MKLKWRKLGRNTHVAISDIDNVAYTIQKRGVKFELGYWTDLRKYVKLSVYTKISHAKRAAEADVNKINKNSRVKRNPVKGAVEIYGNILAIEAIKGDGSLWPKEKFRHDFKSSSKAKVYGLPDGSILIKSNAKKRLWKKFAYKKGIDY